MIIGIDGNEANIKNRVGINMYAFEIIWGMYNIVKDNYEPISIVVYLKDSPLSDMPPQSENFKYKVLKGGKMWILSKLTLHLLTNPEKLDVFFTPSHYLPPFAPIPKVCVIHDLGYLEFSAQFTKYDFWQLKYWTAWSIKISKWIIAVSKSTQKDIVRHYPSSKNKISFVYHGFNENLLKDDIQKRQIEEVKKKYSIVNDYILYLGTLKPSKNIEGLIEGWERISKKFPDITLVIAGRKGWLYKNIFSKVANLGLEKRVVFTDFVQENEKFILVKGAKCFIIPSFWEGFGMDVLTAFAVGTPVVASEIASLPEVVGDAGILIDPSNIDSIAKGIEKVLDMKKIEYNKLISKGKIQLKKFSWEKGAKETLEILRKAANVS